MLLLRIHDADTITVAFRNVILTNLWIKI